MDAGRRVNGRTADVGIEKWNKKENPVQLCCGLKKSAQKYPDGPQEALFNAMKPTRSHTYLNQFKGCGSHNEIVKTGGYPLGGGD